MTSFFQPVAEAAVAPAVVAHETGDLHQRDDSTTGQPGQVVMLAAETCDLRAQPLDGTAIIIVIAAHEENRKVQQGAEKFEIAGDYFFLVFFFFLPVWFFAGALLKAARAFFTGRAASFLPKIAS